ncbi:MAG: flippase-like domain-containing protein, partial [Acidobacteria bacterium]|nr:flippase-like domain-containing protein [Acidobacteriota bacterium]
MTTETGSSFALRPAHLRFLAKALVSASLLVFLLRQVDVQRLGHELRSASAWWLSVAIALYLLMILTSAWRWALMLTAQDINVPHRLLVRSYLVATFFNNFLPSNIGGDVVRISDTAAPAGSKTVATTIVLLDRAVGLIGLLIVATAGLSALGAAPGALALLRPQALWV